MGGFVDASHEFVQSRRPVVENLGLRFLLGEVNDAGWSVDLHLQGVVVDELGQELLSLHLVEVQELGHARAGDASVVACNNSDVLDAKKNVQFEIWTKTVYDS